MSQSFGPLGFSLIELMIVVSIIGILVAMAIPSYLNYTKRARFAEVITTADTYKTAVALALQEGDSLNDLSTGAYDIPEAPLSTKNLANLTVEKGVITATATDLADNVTYILTPNSDGTLWVISGSCVARGWCNA